MKDIDTITPRIDASCIGFAMVRPDSLELGIDQAIVSRIIDEGLEVLAHKIIELSDETIATIYEDLLDKPYYDAMRSCMTGKKAIALAVLSDCSDASGKLMEIKGNSLQFQGSVRADYSLAHTLDGELYERFKSGHLSSSDVEKAGLVNILRDDRLHCEESYREAIRSIRAVFSKGQCDYIFSRLHVNTTELNIPGWEVELLQQDTLLTDNSAVNAI